MNSKYANKSKATGRKCSVTATSGVTSNNLTKLSSINSSSRNRSTINQNNNNNTNNNNNNSRNNMDRNDNDDDGFFAFASRPDSFSLDETLHWSQTQFTAQFHLLAKRLPIEVLEVKLQILNSLRRLVRAHPYAGRQTVLDRDSFAIFECLYQLLIIDHHKTTELSIALVECISLLVDLLTGASDVSVVDRSECIPRVLSRLVPLLGHPVTGVRRACLRLLHVYMRHTSRLNVFIETYITYGLKSPKSNEQKGCILSLPLLFTHEFVQSQEGLEPFMQSSTEPLNLFPLLQCLSELLVHADARLFYAIYLAIQRLHTLLGNNVFRLYLQRVNQEAAMLYDKVLSRNASGAASLANEPIHISDNAQMDDSSNGNENGNNQKSSDSNREESNLRQMNEIRPGDVTRTASRIEPPEPDKYDQMVLDQLASAEEEVREQSFELLSSPSSMINIDEEFGAASANNASADNNQQYQQFKQHQREQLQHLQQQQLQQQSRASQHHSTQESDLQSNCEANSVCKLKPITRSRPYASEMTKNQILQAEWETRQVLQQLDSTGNDNQMFDLHTKPSYSTENILSSSCQEPHLMYGLFPNRLIERCMSSQVATKNEAINQMLAIVKQAPCAQLTLFSSANNLIPFVNQILIRLIDHPNFKVALQALEIVQTLIIRLKHQLLSHLPLIIGSIVRRLADSRVVVKQQTVHTFQLLTAKIPAQPLLEQLLVHVNTRSGRLRSEIINRILALLLQVPRDQFNLCALCHRLPPLLLDPKRSVRLAALECAAVLAHCLGPSRQRRLIECVGVLQHVQKAEGLLGAVRARLARRDLPRLSADGQVRYVLNPTGFAAWYPSAADADIEWVLQGSTSAGNTPPNRSLPLKIQNSFAFSGESNLCSMKRGSCALAGNGSDLYEPNSYRYRQVLVDSIGPPPDTAAKQSDCMTVDIERLIEKTTTDQLKSRELSTGDSQYSLHSQPCNSNLKHGYELLQLNHAQDDLSEMNNDFETLQRHFQKSLNMKFEASSANNDADDDDDDNNNDDYNYNVGNPKRFESSIDVNKIETDSTPVSSLRHSRTLSMPAIASSQLSDISERSEFISFNQNNNNSIGIESHKSDCSFAKESEINKNKASSNELGNATQSKSEQKLTADNSNQRKASIESSRDASEMIKELMNNEVNKLEEEILNGKHIEINVQRASTISEDSKSATLPDYDQLGSELHGRKKSTVSPPKSSGVNESNNSTKNSNIRRASSFDEKSKLSSDSKEASISSQPEANSGNNQLDGNNEQDKATNQLMNAETLAHTEGQEDFQDSNETNKRRYSKSMIPTSVLQSNNRTNAPETGCDFTEMAVATPTNHHHHHQNHQHQLVRIQPAIPSNANIRNILENVTKTEGPFKEPEEALKAAIASFTQDAWTTKVEGMLAVNRLTLFHPNVLKKELHTIVLALAYEVKNLRSTVARSAIFTLADLLKKMKGHIDPEMDIIAQALLSKCGENIQFIREDIEKALDNFVTHMPPVRAALSIVHHGTNHRNILVRRVGAHYLADLIESMGATKALLGPRDLAESLLPSVAALLLDRDPQARYSARRIFNVLMNHAQFNSLLGKHVQPAVYRTIIGSLQSIRRRGVGEKPNESSPSSSSNQIK